MARSAVLAGRTFADLIRNVFVVVLMTIVGVLIGFKPFEHGVPAYFLMLVIVVGFAYAFSWISALIGLLVKDTESVQAAGFIWIFPLTFASSAFVPVATMPDWLQPIAKVNPMVDKRILRIGPPPLVKARLGGGPRESLRPIHRMGET